MTIVPSSRSAACIVACVLGGICSTYTADHPRLGSHGKSAIPWILLRPNLRGSLLRLPPLLHLVASKARGNENPPMPPLPEKLLEFVPFLDMK